MGILRTGVQDLLILRDILNWMREEMMDLQNSDPIICLEGGATHMGFVKVACRLIEAAAVPGISAIKFQTMWGGNLRPHRQGNITYRDSRGEHTESIVALLQSRELDWDAWGLIDRTACALAVPWFSTPDMPATARKLAQMDVCAIKIAGADMSREDLIAASANTGMRILLDTRGGEEELDNALFLCRQHRDDTIIVHTPTGYPTVDSNLNRIQELKRKYPDNVIGYTSHSEGIRDCVQAVLMGAGYIEKGISLDKRHVGIEQLMCLEPGEVEGFVKEIKGAWGG